MNESTSVSSEPKNFSYRFEKKEELLKSSSQHFSIQKARYFPASFQVDFLSSLPKLIKT